MTRLPHPPADATRFFGRVTAATMECPRCGTVLHLADGGRQAIRRARRHHRSPAAGWNPLTSRLECPACELVMLIGLLAWPVGRGGTHGAQTVPRDQVPNERQLSQLRQEAGGWWMPQETRKPRYRPDDSNITAACICRPGAENTTAQDPECPIHGS